jgi:signal transduction histidine kinase
MKLWNRQSISGRLTRVNLLVSGIALLLAFVSFLAYDLYTSRQSLISSLGTEAAIVSANSVTALVFDDQQAAETTLSALRGSPHVLSAVIMGEDGTVFAQYFRDGSAQPVVGPALEPGQSSSYWSRGRNILFGRRITLANKSVGTVYLLAETTDVIRRAARFGLISACILLLCFVTAVLATATIRHMVTEPLTDLAETAQIVTRNRDYSVRARIPRSADELSFLVQSFNEMLEQIQERDRALEESRAVLEQRVQERTAELSAANQELEAFSYSVAHDLRGPLQHIANIGFLLQQVCVTGEDSNGAVLIEKLFEGSNRMSKLIDDLLNLSRATSTPLHRTAIDLSDMVTSILASLQAEDPDRRVRLTVAKGAHVVADEGLLHQVLENLVQNAWKYTARREEAEIEFGLREESEGIVYFIRDNGVGFDPRDADRLFRPFQRLHSQSDFPGTGVGLATVHRIIVRHGGKIWAQGNVDQGAEFSFTVPCQAVS